MKKIFSYIALAIAVVSCAPKTEPYEDAFGKIENVAQIGTVEYTITKLIIANDEAFYKFGDRKTIFSCKVIAKAGIDMKDFSMEDVDVNKEKMSITVTLPYPKVLSFNMPAEEVKCEYSKVSGLRTTFNTEERNDLLRQGERAIHKNLDKLGILKDAKENASMFFQTLLTHAGYKEVVVNFKEKK